MSHADKFDDWTRQLHAEAVSQLSPQALARIRAARHAAVAAAPAPRRRGFAWPWLAYTATGCAVVFAVVLGLRLQAPPEPIPVTPAATATVAPIVSPFDGDPDLVASLGEDPDLYLWLASVEAQSVAMESP